MKRVVFASAIAVGVLTPLTSQAEDRLPTKDCPRDFIARWNADKEAALDNMPKQPCWMRTKTGPYVCYRDGCVRANVYFDE